MSRTATVKLPALDQEVEVRSMKVSEIDILTDRKKMAQGDALDKILKNCLITENLDPVKMLSSDRNALLIAVRRATFGDLYEFASRSPFQTDDKNQDFEVNLSDLEMFGGDRDLVNKWIEDPKATFDYKMECGKIIEWRFVDGNDFKKMLQSIKRGADRATADLLARIVSVKENGEKIQEPLKRFIQNMDFVDMDDFNEFYKEKAPYVDDLINLECQETGQDFEVRLQLDVENFFKRNSRKKRS